jgi:hypothetical protein
MRRAHRMLSVRLLIRVVRSSDEETMAIRRFKGKLNSNNVTVAHCYSTRPGFP